MEVVAGELEVLALERCGERKIRGGGAEGRKKGIHARLLWELQRSCRPSSVSCPPPQRKTQACNTPTSGFEHPQNSCQIPLGPSRGAVCVCVLQAWLSDVQGSCFYVKVLLNLLLIVMIKSFFEEKNQQQRTPVMHRQHLILTFPDSLGAVNHRMATFLALTSSI